MSFYENKYKDAYNSFAKKFPIALPPSDLPALMPPLKPSFRFGPGTLKGSEYFYRVTALNEYGESLPSEEGKFINGNKLSTPVILNSTYAVGILSSGVYTYQVTALNDYGETVASEMFYVSNVGMPYPIMDEFAYSTGTLSKGKYYYQVTALSAQGETLPTTIFEAETNKDNSAVIVRWLPVKGALGYRIYGRDKSSRQLLGETVGMNSVTFLDDGTKIPTADLPRTNTTLSGISITWTPVYGAKTYRIYGRTENNMGLIGEVAADINSFIDTGVEEPHGALPTVDTTANRVGGVFVQWSFVPGATGYKIYGRTQGSERLLQTITSGNLTEWLDSGEIIEDPSTAVPNKDTSSGIYGRLGMVVPDNKTIEIDSNGLIRVKGGLDSFLGKADVSSIDDGHILIYDKINNQWKTIDLKFAIGTFLALGGASYTDFQGQILELLTVNKKLLKENQTLKDMHTNLQEQIDAINATIGTPIK